MNRDALKRAVRTFIQAFVVVYPVQQLAQAAADFSLLDTGLLRSAAIAGAMAVVAYAWKAWLDPSPVPSIQ